MWTRYLETRLCGSIKAEGIAIDVNNAEHIILAFNNDAICAKWPLPSKLNFCDYSCRPFAIDNLLFRPLDPVFLLLFKNLYGTTIVDGSKFFIA